MRLFRHIPIKRKLTIIALLTSGVALLLASVAFAAWELVVFRKSMVNDLLITAEMVGYNSSAALSFDDPASAAETLKSLHADPHIMGGAVYRKDGTLFATYQRAHLNEPFHRPAVEPDGHRFTGNSLRLFRRIYLAGEHAGTVYLQCDLEEMQARLRRYALIVVMVMMGACLVAVLLSARMMTVISGPISHLARVVGVVAREKDYSVRAVKQDNDELGRLVDGFNEMLNQIQTQDRALQEARNHLEKRVAERTQELKSAHSQLMEASRQAGMAEIASNVLHNVGNALNSVNVSCNLVVDSLKRSKVTGLAQVAALLREHQGDLAAFITRDPGGQQLAVYLARLSENLCADREAAIHELNSLQRNIAHIKEIVAMQQNYARVAGVKEMINVVDLVEDSLRMNEVSLGRHGVEVVREFETVPPINADKHAILQILVNLVRNAKYACDESGRVDKRLTVRVAHGEGRIKISVSDNGVGIPPQNLTLIFSHGFTTRAGGHGFGLHSGALAAQEMGGALTVHSDGPGQGAIFTLELPLPIPGQSDLPSLSESDDTTILS